MYTAAQRVSPDSRSHIDSNWTKTAGLITLGLAFSIIANAPILAQDWSGWRGPEQNGTSRETNLVDEWSLEPRMNVSWVSDIGGRATPIVLNGKVYLNCRTDDDVNDPVEKVHAREQVVCWDLKTGKELWRDEFNVFQTDIPAPRVGWASMCGDPETGYVYVHSVCGILRCYTGDGQKVWEISLAEQYGKISGYGGRTQTPLIDEDRLILSFMATNWGVSKGPAPLHYYYSFDKKTGELQWVSAPGGAPKDTNYSAPVVAVIKGQRQLIGGNCDGHVYSINARTGKPIWSFKMSLRGLNTTPVVVGNYVYMSHGEDNVDNTEFGRVQCIDATGTGDVTDTHSVWRVDGIKAGYTALIANDGIVFVVTDLGNMYAYDTKTGDELWVHDLGTVGKGSPIWADGKIYATEVNGNMWILQPSRENCKTLSHVEINARVGAGKDEIYASPIIADGRLILVTRDRTICIEDTSKQPAIGDVVGLAQEAAPVGKIDMIQLRPYEAIVQPGSTTQFSLHAFDANGRFIKELPIASLVVDAGLVGFTANGSSLKASTTESHLTGTLTTTVDEKTATARIRMFNPAKTWKWDFDELKPPLQTPDGWIRAHVKLKPFEVDGEKVLKVTGGSAAKGRPSHQIGLGFAEMKNYEIQADVRLTEQSRKLGNIGLSCQRYNLTMIGNTSRLEILSWAPHKRMGKSVKYRSDPDVWYTMKMKVDVTDGAAKIYGKVWKRSEREPDEWTIEATDPHGNETGSPGLYYYALADCYFDNVIVTQD